MADAAQTPEIAVRYLGELSTDVRCVVILDEAGELAACSGPEDDAVRMRELVLALVDAAAEDGGSAQVEVVDGDGAVFAVRERGWTVAVVTGRLALPSLVFYDLRSTIADLAGAPAA